MMGNRRLVLDAGNTRVKQALFQGDTLLEVQYFPTESYLQQTLPRADMAAFATVSLSEAAIMDALQAANVRNYTFFAPYDELPFPSDYTTPQTMGQDRKAGIFAALARFPKKAALVLSLGSCITADLLTAEGRHLGGDISPGYRMRLQAMHTFTRRLPLPDAEKLAPNWGTDTETALLAGAFGGMLAELEGRISSAEALFGELTVILTGGDAALFEKRLQKQIFAEPNLALYGLNALLDKTFFGGK